jgi:hypothetical protein
MAGGWASYVVCIDFALSPALSRWEREPECASESDCS